MMIRVAAGRKLPDGKIFDCENIYLYKATVAIISY
jgi:hypothetical protein